MNKEVIALKEFKTSKNGFVTPLPTGFDSQDEFEMGAPSFPIFVIGRSSDSVVIAKAASERPHDKGDSFIVGDLGD